MTLTPHTTFRFDTISRGHEPHPSRLLSIAISSDLSFSLLLSLLDYHRRFVKNNKLRNSLTSRIRKPFNVTRATYFYTILVYEKHGSHAVYA